MRGMEAQKEKVRVEKGGRKTKEKGNRRGVGRGKGGGRGKSGRRGTQQKENNEEQERGDVRKSRRLKKKSRSQELWEEHENMGMESDECASFLASLNSSDDLLEVMMSFGSNSISEDLPEHEGTCDRMETTDENLDEKSD